MSFASCYSFPANGSKRGQSSGMLYTYLAHGVSLKPIVCQDAPQVGVATEENAIHVPGLGKNNKRNKRRVAVRPAGTRQGSQELAKPKDVPRAHTSWPR